MDVKLPDICNIQYGFPFDSAQFSTNTGVPLIRIRDVVRGYSETYTTEVYSEEYIVNNGDLLIGMDGEFNIARWNGGRALLNQRVCRLIPKRTIDKGYLFYFMPQALKHIEDKTPFATVKHLSAKQLNTIIIPLPSLEEQQHIATVLDKLCNLISLRKQQLTKLDELVKARFVEMFGDLKRNNMNWPSRIFADFAIIDTTMVHDFEKYSDYPHIGIDSIEKETGKLLDYRLVKEDSIISGKYLFTPKHIIYSKIRPNLNKVALPDFTGVCSADAYPILPKEGTCNREFLAYTLRSSFFLEYILAFSNRTNLPKVNKQQVEGFCCPIPDWELQEKFASFYRQVNGHKLTIQQSLDKLAVLKKSLMQEYFGCTEKIK